MKTYRIQIKKLKTLSKKQRVVLGLFVLVVVAGASIGAYFYVTRDRIDYGIKKPWRGEGEFVFKNSNKDFSAEFAKKDADKPVVKFASGQNEMTMTLLGERNKDATADAGKVQVVKDGEDKLVFPDALPNTDLTYQIIDHGVKEEIVVKSGEAFSGDKTDPTYEFELELNNTRPVSATDNYFTPEFVDASSGEYAFHFEKPVMIDAKGEKSEDVRVYIKPTEEIENLKFKISNSYRVILVPSLAWLTDPARSYPVRIDPTVVHDTEAEFDTGRALNRIDSAAGPQVKMERLGNQSISLDGLVGYWPFDGTFRDEGVNGLHGTCKTAALGWASNTGTKYCPTFVSGKFGQAAKFQAPASATNSDHNYLDLASNSKLNLTYFTYSMWVKPDLIVQDDGVSNSLINLQASGNLCGNAAGSQLIIASNFQSTYLMTASTDAGGAGRAVTHNMVWDTSWRHFAVTYNGGTKEVKFYSNGSLIGTYTMGGDGIHYYSGTPVWKIGAQPNEFCYRDASLNFGNTYGYNGLMDDLAIYNRVLSAEEIQTVAQGAYDFGTYVSPVIDSGDTGTDWKTIQWIENAVQTGDGEILHSNADLVAQWNLNETSGTAAPNSGGSCGSACNGTLTNFASTGSQDAAVQTGWTANNKRWGTGALMFDGSNDWVDLGDSWNPGTNNFTVEYWVKTSDVTGNWGRPIQKRGTGDSSVSGFQVCHYGGSFYNTYMADGAGNVVEFTYNDYKINDGQWHFVSLTWNNATGDWKLYVDGKYRETATKIGTLAGKNITSSKKMTLGAAWNDAGNQSQYLQGALDAVRIYSRELSAAEVIANYQAGNVDIQTRTGSSTNPDDGTWEAWRPAGTETQVLAADSDVTNWDGGYDAYTKLLIHADGANGVKSFGDKSVFTKTVTSNGDARVSTSQSKFGGASAYFDGTGDYLSVPNSDDWNFGTGDFTIDFWVYRTSDSPAGWVAKGASTYARVYLLYTGAVLHFYSSNNGSSWNVVNALDFGAVPLNTWTHIALVRSGNSFLAFNHGSLANTATSSESLSGDSGPLYVGQDAAGGNRMTGYIDELRVSKGVARWTSGFTVPSSAYKDPSWLATSDSTNVKMEGTSSLKVDSAPQINGGSTVGLWHLEETGGTGAYIKDSSSNANHATPTGTSVATGWSGKARSFNGSQLITIPNDGDYNFSSDFTVSAWIKPTSLPGTPQGIVGKGTYGAGGWGLQISGNNKANFGMHGCSNYDAATILQTNTWYHIVGIFKAGAYEEIYVNGKFDGKGDVTSANCGGDASNVVIGAMTTAGGYYFNGVIDEVAIYNRALTAEEILEGYRGGRDSRVTRTLSAFDLSAKTKFPFYVAGDRPGTYLKSTVGESAFANYEPDNYTAGLWHFDEPQEPEGAVDSATKLMLHMDVGNGAQTFYDDSPNARSVTYNGNAVQSSAQLRFGPSSAYFDGTGDFLNVADSTDWDLGGGNMDFTVDFWIKTSDTSNYPSVIGRNVADGTSGLMVINIRDETGGKIGIYRYGSTPGGVIMSNSGVADDIWHHVAFVRAGNTLNIYVDGKSNGSGAWTNYDADVAGDLLIGRGTNSNYDFTGYIDELRITKGVARWKTDFAPPTRVYYPPPTTKDACGYGNHGSTIGTSEVEGKVGTARNFLGGGDYVSLGTPSSLLFNNGDQITVSGWINPSLIYGYNTIIAKPSPCANAGNWMVDIGSNLRFCYENAAYTQGHCANILAANPPVNTWTHFAATYTFGTGSTFKSYINGQLVNSGTWNVGTGNEAPYTNSSNAAEIGHYAGCNTGLNYFFNGSMDEIRVDRTTRTAEEIRQAFEVGKRTHPITIDFTAALDAGNLIADTNDTSFTIDGRSYGATNMGDNIYVGEKIIVKENYDGTEYVAQGTVNAVTPASGAVTVSSWDSGSTFPASGYTVNATVFKWQREYWDVTAPLDGHVDAATRLTLRATDASAGRSIYLDDFKTLDNYLTSPTATENITSTDNRYLQYRAVLSSTDEVVTPYVSSVSVSTDLGVPTGVTATDGTHTDKVTVTWEAVAGATGYKVWNGQNWIDVGNVLTYDDTAAPPPTITAGAAVATDGTSNDHISLSIAGASVSAGTVMNYQVRAYGPLGDGEASAFDAGNRGASTLNYQWQRSGDDADVNYSNMVGITTATYDDASAPAGTITPGTATASDGASVAHVTLSLAGEGTTVGVGRYYRAYLTSTDAVAQYTSTNRGYRGVGAISYQWQRSAADSDAAYSDIGGATTDPYNDTGAPADGSGRYFKCVLNASGAAQQTSTVNRGYRLGAPTVTTQAVSGIGETTATGNGTIVLTGNENPTRSIEWGTTSGVYTQNCTAGVGGAGAYTCGLSSLDPGKTYYVRATATNAQGTGTGAEVSFTTTLAAPTGVSATDGAHTDKVVITWNAVTGATGYQVWNGSAWVDVGNVLTYDDTNAGAGTIIPGAATASDGTSPLHVTLSLAGESTSNGASIDYKVKAYTVQAESAESSTNSGYRGVGAITYQWQRSAADSDAAYSNISGGTTDPYNDTGAPSDGSGRYFKCVLNATGASQQISTTNRGFRTASLTVVTSTPNPIEKYGATLQGNITADGGEVVTERGFQYGLTETPTWTESEAGAFGAGVYSLPVTLSDAFTIYYVRAYAVTATYTRYGDWVQFKTEGVPVNFKPGATYKGTVIFK